MPDFLEGLGASKAITSGVKAVSGLSTDIQNRAVSRANVAIAEDANSRANRAFDYEMKKKLEQDKIDNTLYPVDDIYAGTTLASGNKVKLDATPNQRNYLHEVAQKNGWLQDIGGVPSISDKHLKAFRSHMSEKLEVSKQYTEIGIQDVNKKIEEIATQMTNPEAKMNDKDREAAMQQIEGLRQKRQVLINGLNALDKDIRKQQVTNEGKTKTETRKTNAQSYLEARKKEYAENNSGATMPGKEQADALLEGIRKTEGQTGNEKIVATLVTKLPEQRESAQKSANGLNRIKAMKDLLSSGVTGKPGQLKAWVAGWAEFLNIDESTMQEYSDAQKFQLFGRVMTGPMRLEIVGPGPVTEYEQSLWERLSATGGASEDAARALLNMYEGMARENVNFYNSNVEAGSRMNQNVSVAFPKIDISGAKDQYEVGKIYEDANGNKAKYLGDGKWEQ